LFILYNAFSESFYTAVSAQNTSMTFSFEVDFQ